MKSMRASKEILSVIEPLLQTAQYELAKQRLEEIHIEFHDEAFVHLQVHRWLLRIARIQGDRRRMISEILPIIFAVPVSYVQRYIGLALPSRMKKGGC
jgi:uncharacterized protein DUF3703